MVLWFGRFMIGGPDQKLRAFLGAQEHVTIKEIKKSNEN